MRILICNVGSTSLKYRLFEMDGGEQALALGKMERVGAPMGRFTFESGDVNGDVELPLPDYACAITRMLDTLRETGALPSPSELACVGFKVVHGGPVSGVRELGENVLTEMAKWNAVAPAHNPPYIAAIRQFRALLPDTPLIGSFETGFHQTLPKKAYLYSLPRALCESDGIRRYGFHGASLEYVSERVAALAGTKDIKLVACHLGGSGSVCAVVNGASVDTNLGFSLQCGLPHNNRAGDIDPYILVYLMKEKGYTLADVERLLSRESGLLGMSGVSNDLRDVERAAREGNVWAQDAFDAYCYQLKKQIGAYAAAMGGLDAIAFSGGIGENSASVRRESLAGLQFLGVSLDEQKNEACRCDAELSDGTGRVKIYVVATDEERIVARKAAAFLRDEAARG